MIEEKDLREALCEIGRRVWTRGFVASNDGNFSFRVAEDRILCTPTMLSKGFMKPKDMIVVDMEGKRVEGTRQPTSEIRAHLMVYAERPGAYSVVHVHPPHATAFAIARRNLPKGVLPEVEVTLGEVPLAPYATTGTWEFARTIQPWARTHDAFLLASHGALTVGQDPYDAYYKMETLDQYCRILLLSMQAGGWRTLEPEAMQDLLHLKQRLGIPDHRAPDRLHEPGVPKPEASAVPDKKPFRPHPGPLEDSPKVGGFTS